MVSRRLIVDQFGQGEKTPPNNKVCSDRRVVVISVYEEKIFFHPSLSFKKADDNY
jgi:hypothetical protein